MANLTSNLVDVEVEFDYVAELGDELTIQTGDIINDVKRMSGGWWEGTLNGKRGLFPDNFVKVMSNDVGKTQQTLVGTSAPKDPVQLRTSQKKHGTVAARKRCRVLYSYQPKHEDELELKVDDIIDFESEVEDGWWKGSLRGQCGVFPSNFVELLRSSVSQLTAAASGSGEDETNLENRIADKNKKNEKLRVEKSSIVSGRISSIIQEAETKMKKKSAENLNIAKRESLVTSEYSEKAKPEVGAPKLPPKPSMGLPLSSNGKFTQKNFSRSTSSLNEGTLSSLGLLAHGPQSKSSLVSADEDFHYINKSNLSDYINQNISIEQTFAKKPSRLTQFLGRLSFDGKSNSEVPGQLRWFKFRPKHKLSASISNVFSKIVEENGGEGQSQVCTLEKPVCMSAKKALPRSRSRSEHDLCNETISRICPTTGICTIDRGSQTDLKPRNLGRKWKSFVFRRRREPSVQTLPEYFDSIEEDDSEGGFWNFDTTTSKRVERKYCRSESEIYANICQVSISNSMSSKVGRIPGDSYPRNRHSTSTLLNMDKPKEITNGSKFFQSSNDIRSSQRSNSKNMYRRPSGEKLAQRNSLQGSGPGSTQSCTSPQSSNVGLPYSRFYMKHKLWGLSRCTFNF